jgi:LuxR family transcriptional regulator, transcriptional regulator of spore coat protein
MSGSARASADPMLEEKTAPELRSSPQWDKIEPQSRGIWRVTERAPRLTPRETEVLEWLAFGKSASETGVILDISVCTVRLHIQNIKKKLGASNIAHAVAQAHNAGILGPTRSEPSLVTRSEEVGMAGKPPTSGGRYYLVGAEPAGSSHVGAGLSAASPRAPLVVGPRLRKVGGKK